VITSKKDLKYYLEADRLSLGKTRKNPRLLGDEVWRFQRTLRKLEYYMNCKKSIIFRPVVAFYKLIYYLQCVLFGYTISPNVLGPGLSIAHRGTLLVHRHSKVGANCRLHICVNIGSAAGTEDDAPIIGNNVYIGPGVKMFGKIEIADNIVIGANAVVNRSFLEPGITIAGIPAKKIADKGSDGFVVKGTEILKKLKTGEKTEAGINPD